MQIAKGSPIIASPRRISRQSVLGRKYFVRRHYARLHDSFLKTFHSHLRTLNRWPGRAHTARYFRKTSLPYSILAVRKGSLIRFLCRFESIHNEDARCVSTNLFSQPCFPTPFYVSNATLEPHFQHQSTPSHQQPPPITGLAAGLCPHHITFTSPHASSSSISSLLSGKHASSYSSPPSSPKLGSVIPTFTSSKELPTAQEAMLADSGIVPLGSTSELKRSTDNTMTVDSRTVDGPTTTDRRSTNGRRLTVG